jgi:hypothetical protein
MAIFAKVDDFGIVENIVVVPDDQAYRGEDYMYIDLGQSGIWVESFPELGSHKEGKIGHTFFPDSHTFAGPQPYPSWDLDVDGVWQPPVPKPPKIEYTKEERRVLAAVAAQALLDGLPNPNPPQNVNWQWDEATLSWIAP